MNTAQSGMRVGQLLRCVWTCFQWQDTAQYEQLCIKFLIVPHSSNTSRVTSTVFENVLPYSELNHTNCGSFLCNSAHGQQAKLKQSTRSGVGSQRNCWVSQSNMTLVSAHWKATNGTLTRKGYPVLVAGFFHNEQVIMWNRTLSRRWAVIQPVKQLHVFHGNKNQLPYQQKPVTRATDNKPGSHQIKLTLFHALIIYSFSFISTLTSHLWLRLPIVSCLRTCCIIFWFVSDEPGGLGH